MLVVQKFKIVKFRAGFWSIFEGQESVKNVEIVLIRYSSNDIFIC